MGSMDAAESTAAAATAMIVDRPAVAEHLLDDETRVEPYVMLERGPRGVSVRKLTAAEKLADEAEQEEFFNLLKAPAEDE